jgi:hypothetical protein
MSRGGALAAAALAGMAALAGCQTWLDRADAAALETCAKFTDEAERAKCRETVVATERAKQQKLIDDMELRQQESEERERLNEVFGDPKKP